MDWHSARDSSTTPWEPTPDGPAISASLIWTLPSSTAFDSGGFSYGSQCSSESSDTRACGSCLRAAIAANVPAGPPPMTTTFLGRVLTLRAKGGEHVLDVVVGVGDHH